MTLARIAMEQSVQASQARQREMQQAAEAARTAQRSGCIVPDLSTRVGDMRERHKREQEERLSEGERQKRRAEGTREQKQRERHRG